MPDDQISDFIILIIAAHTALSVLRPRKPGGLQRYRWVAYTCWAMITILLPAIAFANKQKAYVSQGTYCYLPIRPFWYRIVLSWAPRYFILCAIMCTYLTIYIYTKHEFGKFDVSSSSGPASTGEITSNVKRPGAASYTISSLRGWFGQRRENKHHPLGERSIPMVTNRLVLGDSTTLSEGLAPDPPSSLPRKSTLLEALRDRTLFPATFVVAKDKNDALRKRHKAIQRQLRYMFIYPLAYLLMWTPPFVNHCYYYTVEYNPPFQLNCVAIICVTLQCAIDCLIFNIRETPWQGGPAKGGYAARSASMSEGSVIAAAHIKREPKAPEESQRAAFRNVHHSVEAQSTRRAGMSPRPQPKPGKHWWDNESL